MKEFWLQKNECTGCGVCADICPRSAIQMKEDEMGFVYPNILDNCIDCNLCEKVCISRKGKNILNKANPDVYAVWAKDADTRYHSTSGGAFSELANVTLKEKGFVVGARYREDNLVEEAMISDTTELFQLRQSKYIQSKSEGIYEKIKSKLDEGKRVLFCGTPCQVAALYAYLGKKVYRELVTIDFICRGVNSPKAYSSWLKEIEDQEKSRVKKVWFKYKDQGWNKSPMRTRIDFEDGHYIVKGSEDNLFMRGYLAYNLYMRPCCAQCEFKGVPRYADITLADFWGISEELDDDQGVSLVLINSENGKQIFEKIQNEIYSQQRKFLEILKGNVCFDNSVNISEKSEMFLKDLDSGSFSKILKKYTKQPFSERMIQKIKNFWN